MLESCSAAPSFSSSLRSHVITCLYFVCFLPKIFAKATQAMLFLVSQRENGQIHTKGKSFTYAATWLFRTSHVYWG